MRCNRLRVAGLHRQRGQGVVAFVVMVGVFGTFLLGILQVALLYRAKTTVDYAAFTAARDGALNGATQASVNAGLVKGLAPLYAAAANAEGLVKAVALAKAAEVQGLASATIVSPTQAMFNQAAVTQFDGVQAIPNDDLAYRSAAVRTANLLKVRVTYDYPLIVPVIDRIIGGICTPTAACARCGCCRSRRRPSSTCKARSAIPARWAAAERGCRRMAGRRIRHHPHLRLHHRLHLAGCAPVPDSEGT